MAPTMGCPSSRTRTVAWISTGRVAAAAGVARAATPVAKRAMAAVVVIVVARRGARTGRAFMYFCFLAAGRDTAAIVSG